jgi:hypothetical protein
MRLRIVTLFSLYGTLFATCAGLGGCMSTQPPLGMPDASVIGYDAHGGGRAMPPQCRELDQPSYLTDAGTSRPGVAFGCATYGNLAAMLARPADLVDPLPYAGADASRAADAVRRYEEGRVTPLNPTYTTAPVKH